MKRREFIAGSLVGTLPGGGPPAAQNPNPAQAPGAAADVVIERCS